MEIILAIIILAVIVALFVLTFKSGAGITSLFVAVTLILLDTLLNLFGKRLKYPGFIKQELHKRITHEEEK